VSDQVEVALIVAVGSAVNALLQIYSNRQRDDQHAQTKQAIEEVRKDVNGQTAQLLQVSGDAREAKGNLVGRAEQKAHDEAKE